MGRLKAWLFGLRVTPEQLARPRTGHPLRRGDIVLVGDRRMRVASMNPLRVRDAPLDGVTGVFCEDPDDFFELS